MDPPGSDLTVSQLLFALKWKLDRLPTMEASNMSELDLSEITSQRESALLVLSMLSGRHNSLQPFNRLPMETLADIFHIVQDHTKALFPPAAIDELKKGNSWLSVTHVCQYWRQCSLAFPVLWQNIVLGPETRDDGSLGQLFVLNSKSTPLFYTHVMKSTTGRDLVAPTSRPIRTFFQGLRDNSDRIELIHTWSAYYIQTQIWEFLNHPLPSLRSLHLDLTPVNFAREAEDTTSLPVIMGGQTSNLKRLSLCNICLWAPNTFEQLTHLCLRDQNDRHRPSIPQFLNSLENMPLLQVLCLRSVGPILRLPITPPRRKINLLELRRVELACIHQPEIEAPCYILHYFNMPVDVVIIICSPAMFRSTVIFRHHLPPPSYISKITSFDLCMTAGQYLLLDQSHIRINSSISLEACFLLMSMSTFKNVTHITLNRAFGLPNNQFGRMVLPAFPALQTLQINVPSDYVPILEALQKSGQTPLVPQFTQLIVCDVGDDLSAYKPASRIVLRPHREAGTTVISRRGMGRSYKVIVQPYVPAALPLRRKLLCER
jgi:hypothetical protein